MPVYRINYVLDGGVNDDDALYSYTLMTGGVVLKPASKEGKEFVGWFSDAGCTQAVESIAADSIGNVTLYAGWQ